MLVGFGLRSARLRRPGLRRAFYVPILVRSAGPSKMQLGQGKEHVVQKEKSKLLWVSPIALWFQAFACPPSADDFIYGLHP